MAAGRSGTAGRVQLRHLIAALVNNTTGVRHALLLSTDGRLLLASDTLSIASADRFACLAGTLLRLAQGEGKLFTLGDCGQVTTWHATGCSVLTRLGTEDAVLIVADHSSDIHIIRYRLARFLPAFARALTPETKAALRVAAVTELAAISHLDPCWAR